MTNWKTTLTLVAALAAGATPVFVAAQAEPAAAVEQAQTTGQVAGKVSLPGEVPDWFAGGELDLSRAVAVIEGNFDRPTIPYPEGYAEMSREDKAAWQKAFMQSDAYKQYMQQYQAAFASRPIYRVPVNADGSFLAQGIKPGKHYITVVIPHKEADLTSASLARHSWASARGKPFQVEPNAKADVGELEFRLQNVVMPGDVAPAWTATTYDGKEIKLSDFRGKYVLIDFWATWCGPCKAEIPNLEAVYKDFGSARFEMIGLSLDANIDLPKNYHEENPSPYVHGYLGQWNKTETTARAYGVVGIPSIWLIGPDGKVVARDLRGEALREAVRKAVQPRGGLN